MSTLCSLTERLRPQLMRLRGAYLLFLKVYTNLNIQTRGRVFEISAGLYAYVGSGYGRGGIFARLSRHICGRSNAFWHIDYLLNNKGVRPVGYAVFSSGLETEIADALIKAYSFVEGFGCSDRPKSASHLFHVKSFNETISYLMRVGRKPYMYIYLRELT